MKLFKSLLILPLIIVSIGSKAQVQTTAIPSPGLELNQNPFLDASTNYDISFDPTSAGKGMVFPRTDLTTFTFRTELMDGLNFPTALDGMIVYNVATGSTKVTDPFGGLEILVKPNNGEVTTVSPGFYYFYNPARLDEFGYPIPADTVEFGKWIPISNSGSGVSTTPIKNIVPITPIDTGVAIDGKSIWAVKGSFIIAPLNATAVILGLPKPDGLTGYIKMTTYKDGKTFRSEISSLTIDPLPAVNTITVVTGNGMFSEVYPAGAYDYTLEFFIN